jgi:hypothetical protein
LEQSPSPYDTEKYIDDDDDDDAHDDSYIIIGAPKTVWEQWKNITSPPGPVSTARNG